PTPAAELPATATTPNTADSPLRDAVDACQRHAITQALARHQGNWAQAARALEVDASNLHKLARRLGLK
ncbi:helix-turn-helix domain-containing protein, partial [Acidovorax sp. HMWF018]